jgi:hypothetical protein
MARLAQLLPLTVAVASACAASTPSPVTRAAPREAPAERTAEPLPIDDEVPKTDGLDLIETPAQTYARVHGSCDFRDASEPSPLDRATGADLVLDLRDPSTLASPEELIGLRAMPPTLASVAKRLAKRDAALEACGAGYASASSPNNAGPVAVFRLLPHADAAGLRVERDPDAPDMPITRCLERRLGELLRDLRVEREFRLNIIVPDAAFPKGWLPSATLDKALIRRVIHRHIGEVRDCYERAMAIWPEIAGTVTVRFAIDTSTGRVLDARVLADDIGQPALACCIARNVYGWQFPGTGAAGLTVVTYPFILQQTVGTEPP